MGVCVINQMNNCRSVSFDKKFNCDFNINSTSLQRLQGCLDFCCSAKAGFQKFNFPDYLHNRPKDERTAIKHEDGMSLKIACYHLVELHQECCFPVQLTGCKFLGNHDL